MATFRVIEKADPVNDLGPELGLFDRSGLLAASYRRHNEICQVWEWQPAGNARFLILDTEERARLFCLRVAQERGILIEPPPDLDAMFTENLSQ